MSGRLDCPLAVEDQPKVHCFDDFELRAPRRDIDEAHNDVRGFSRAPAVVSWPGTRARSMFDDRSLPETETSEDLFSHVFQ